MSLITPPDALDPSTGEVFAGAAEGDAGDVDCAAAAVRGTFNGEPSGARPAGHQPLLWWRGPADRLWRAVAPGPAALSRHAAGLGPHHAAIE